MSVFGAAMLGIGLGAITGMPLGVVNVAIVDAAVARRRAYATGLAVGGATADSVHAALAFLGIGRVVTAHPEWIRVMAIVAAIAILGYAALAWRRHREAKPVTGERLGRGFAAGLALTLPNPGALAAWAAVAASLWPGAETTEAIAIAVGVGVGSAGWFTLLGRLTAKVRPDHPALRVVPRLALVLFVGIAVVGVVRSW
ncbi:MAG: LysE family transporter [Myxococcales bacterium]|nr:LysE family transporter [Myxococcales bacterium]